MNTLKSINGIKHLDSGNFFLLAGPCVVENEEITFGIAEKVMEITDKYKIPYITTAAAAESAAEGIKAYLQRKKGMAVKSLQAYHKDIT